MKRLHIETECQVCGEKAEFTAQNFDLARATAEKTGWQIDTLGYCTCPKHTATPLQRMEIRHG